MGILGGLGPYATNYFYELILNMTKAEVEQDHLEVIIYNKPSIPDRTSYILDNRNPNPVFEMIEAGKALEDLSVDYIAIPCITAHYYYNGLQSHIRTPIIHAVKETAHYLKNYGASTVGIMATKGTILSNLLQDKLQEYGIKSVVPGLLEQEYVNNIIYDNVKAGRPVDMNKFNLVADNLRDQGADIIILGCSELSMIKNDYDIGCDFIDTMEVLARRCIDLCNGNLKKEYEFLIKKEIKEYA